MRIEQLRQRLQALGALPCHEQRVLQSWVQIRSLDTRHRRAENFLPLALRNALPEIFDELAALLGLKRRTEVFRMQRTINNYRPEPLLAAMPGVALDELWQTVGFVEKTLFALSSIVVIVGLTGLMSTMLAGLDQRRREMAILRALGAGPRDIFAMLIAEGVIVTALGCLLGCLFLAFGIVSLQPLIQSQFGVVLSYAPPAQTNT